jgi:hypothetical protein
VKTHVKTHVLIHVLIQVGTPSKGPERLVGCVSGVSTNAAVGKWMYIPSIDDARVTVG